MINKQKLQSVINKYYLNVNEAVKWVIEDNTLSIDFMSPTKDIIGKLTCNEFELEDSTLAIYDTKKLNSLVSICNGDLLLELEKTNKIFTKLKISDLNLVSILTHYKILLIYLIIWTRIFFFYLHIAQ